MKVGFIGAGRVGKAMGQYFFKKGLLIQGYMSKTQDSAKKAACLTKSKLYTDMATLAVESDVIAIAVPDDSIKEIANSLCSADVEWKGKTVLHFSGVQASNILDKLYLKGASICSLHPMFTFCDYQKNEDTDTFENIFFTAEGKGEGKNSLIEIIKSWGNRVIDIETDNKVLYHCAGCVGSNYLVTLIDVAIQMLKEAGFEEEQAMDCIEPLIRKTVDNIFAQGTKKALTGPISRGDVGTVEKHIEKLKEFNNNWINIYKIMGLQTLEMTAWGRGKNDSLGTGQ